MVCEDGDLDRRDLADAVGVVEEGAARLVVDDAVLGVGGLLAGEEGVLVSGAAKEGRFACKIRS